jgi:hypothetical protein
MTFQTLLDNKITPIDFANMSIAEQIEVKDCLIDYQSQAEDAIQDPELGDHNKAEYREKLVLAKKMYNAFVL